MNRHPRVAANAKYLSARTNLLLVVVLTVLNMAFLFNGSATMMLFSASVPYFLTVLAIGHDSSFYLICAVLITLFYFLCWLFSRKHPTWLIVATALFSLDTMIMIVLVITGDNFSDIIDFAIHGFVLYCLICGVIYGFKQQKTLEDTLMDLPLNEGSQTTAPLRMAETDIKHRVFLETEIKGIHICYRRVKSVDQLVINGYIYAEFKPKFIETGHELAAFYQGAHIAVGCDGQNSFLSVNGTVILQKRRLY